MIIMRKQEEHKAHTNAIVRLTDSLADRRKKRWRSTFGVHHENILLFDRRASAPNLGVPCLRVLIMNNGITVDVMKISVFSSLSFWIFVFWARVVTPSGFYKICDNGAYMLSSLLLTVWRWLQIIPNGSASIPALLSVIHCHQLTASISVRDYHAYHLQLCTSFNRNKGSSPGNDESSAGGRVCGKNGFSADAMFINGAHDDDTLLVMLTPYIKDIDDCRLHRQIVKPPGKPQQ